MKLYKCYPRPPPGPFYRICERQRKTTQKADSLEAAIDYAMNRTKTEQAVLKIPSDVPMKMRMKIWWQRKGDSIRWAV